MKTDATYRRQSLEVAQEKYGNGWVAVAISEKQHESAWGVEGRIFLVALRRPEHADFPFPGPLPSGMEDIPNKVYLVFWQGDYDYAVQDTVKISEWSRNPDHPTTNEFMSDFRQLVMAHQTTNNHHKKKKRVGVQ